MIKYLQNANDNLESINFALGSTRRKSKSRVVRDLMNEVNAQERQSLVNRISRLQTNSSHGSKKQLAQLNLVDRMKSNLSKASSKRSMKSKSPRKYTGTSPRFRKQATSPRFKRHLEQQVNQFSSRMNEPPDYRQSPGVSDDHQDGNQRVNDYYDYAAISGTESHNKDIRHHQHKSKQRLLRESHSNVDLQKIPAGQNPLRIGDLSGNAFAGSGQANINDRKQSQFVRRPSKHNDHIQISDTQEYIDSEINIKLENSIKSLKSKRQARNFNISPNEGFSDVLITNRISVKQQNVPVMQTRVKRKRSTHRRHFSTNTKK